jgi:hypothetical protein
LADAKLPEATIKRLTEALKSSAPTKEDGSIDTEALEAKIEEAVKAEAAYLGEIMGGGKVMGNGSGGGGTTEGTEAANKKLEEAFRGMGHSEERAKAEAAGR